MLFRGTNDNDILQGTNRNDTLRGNAGDDILISNDGDDLVAGGNGNDLLLGFGDDQDPEAALAVGGSDTLTGGKGQDGYAISLENGGGSIIRGDSSDLGVFIFAENTDGDALNAPASATTEEESMSIFNDPETFGDAVIELSRPERGSVGLRKSGTSLIIDISRDGMAKASDDLTIRNYFDDQGDLGSGAPLIINNIIDQQDIVDFFA